VNGPYRTTCSRQGEIRGAASVTTARRTLSRRKVAMTKKRIGKSSSAIAFDAILVQPGDE
jgi:hypothetical protein